MALFPNLMTFIFYITITSIIIFIIVYKLLFWFLKTTGAEFSKDKRKNTKFDDLVHQAKEYRLFELKTKSEQNTKHIPINIPTICPICGLNIEGFFKYKIKNKEDIEISLCEKHYRNLRKKPRFISDRIDLILILGLIINSIIGIFIYILTQNLNVFTIILIMNGIPLFVYLLRKIIENSLYNRYLGQIYDHVRLGFSKDSFMIRIKNSDWASEFRHLNNYNWKEIPSDSEMIKEQRGKAFKWVIVLIFWIIISIPVTIISSISLPIFYGKLIVYFFVFIPLFIIILILIFHFSKEQHLKSFTSSKSERIVFIIIFILLFLLITLDFFEVLIIFSRM